MSHDPRQDALVSGDFTEPRTDDLNAPVEWRGLPAFVPVTRDVRLVLTFDDEAGREELIEQLGLVIAKKTGKTWSAWWPPRDRDDLAALRFDFGDDGSASLPDVAEEEPDDALELSHAPEDADVVSDADAVNGAHGQQAAEDEADSGAPPDRLLEPGPSAYDPFEF